MHLQTAEHYAKALAEFGIQSMSALQALQLVPNEVIACKQWNKFGHALLRTSAASLFIELVSENDKK